MRKAMAMKITDAMLGEHGVLNAQISALRAKVLPSGDIDELRRAVAALEASLASHARLEEELLFPALAPHLGQAGPLEVMRREHESIDNLMQVAGSGTDPDTVRTALSALLDLAHVHFQKEEQVLFPMAQDLLDDANLTALGDEWAARRGVTVRGAGCLGMR